MRTRTSTHTTRVEAKNIERAHHDHVALTALGDASRPVTRDGARAMLAQLTGGCELCEVSLYVTATCRDVTWMSLFVAMVKAAGIRGAKRCLTSPEILMFIEHRFPVSRAMVRWAGHTACCGACSTVLLGEFGLATARDRREHAEAAVATDAIIDGLAKGLAEDEILRSLW